ncbi:MAG TPA: prepilin peptidase [Clostridiales bacterium]|nr:prepilin peptidase [Clostridiales bacterium]
MVEVIINSITGTMLLVCGLQDIKMKKFYTWMVLLGAILIAICVPFCSTITIWDRLWGSSVGLVVLLISLLTEGKIGMGDGFILCVTGISLGFWNNLELFFIALILSAILSIILLAAKKVDRKQGIPFVPFIFMAFVIGRIGI